MAIVNVKCTECGAVLKISEEKEAAVCSYCGNAFIVEKAIANYNNTYNIINNVDEQTVNIFYNKAENLIKRGYILLEFGDFNKANKTFNQALEFEPENGDAYLGLLLASLNIPKREYLSNMNGRIRNIKEYKQAYRFGNDSVKELLDNCIVEKSETANSGKLKKGIPLVCKCIDCVHNLTEKECTEYWKKPINGVGYCPDFKAKKN